MVLRDYYVALGVPRTEGTAGIRSAFRDLAKKHHPDRFGAEDSEAFRELVEAYRVLPDAALRRRYDERLRRQEGTRQHVTVRRAAAEPLADEPLPLFGRGDRG